MFGSSMAAHHLLYTYLTVWAVQGGYLAWIVWQWMRTKPNSHSADQDDL
jgi:threonine/homoserine/homoserine lactone efflux protein